MLRKITLLLSASMFFGPTLAPQPKTHRWGVVEVPTLGQQQYFNCWNFSVGPMLGQCQHANDVLPTTPTITQHWPNNCLLSGSANLFRRVCSVMRIDLLDFDQFTSEHLCELLQSLSFLLFRAVKVHNKLWNHSLITA